MTQPHTELTSYEDLNAAIGNDSNQLPTVMLVEMSVLRNMAGAGKLGASVRDRIKEDLGRYGLHTAPESLPTAAWQSVEVYRANTRVAHIINAVLNPSSENVEYLLDVANTEEDSAESYLERIKGLVLEYSGE